MKKKIIGSIAILAIATVAAFNIQLNTTTGNKLSDISLANVEALAAIDVTLPEVVIVCGKTSGRCWREECLITWTPFGPMRFRECVEFTGSQSSLCAAGLPCY